ncbi:MAG: hypothetical protein DDT22_01088 [candidate division WS2 bacterium]|nr:hypothetical protein [Candidatus Lithacetigena glycinireducens]
MVKLIIFGSRTLMGNHVRNIIKDAIEKYRVKEVITSGEITGVCQEAYEVCKRMKVPIS